MGVKRTNIPAGTSWEDVVGYSRAVRVGSHIHISGTVATDSTGAIVGFNDAYRQAKHILEKIETALKAAGGSLKDVVRTRVYVTDMDHWQQVGKAHGEAFKSIRPATTLVQIARLIDPQLLVEIEADAIATDAGPKKS